ncbi:MAG: LTA synthase family protein [Muribaculaceae bacterium]|nr:LTA synthase family protein [Muribaculaceae bacterium]
MIGRVTKFLFGSDLWKSQLGVMTAMSIISLLWYIIDWCSFTTFRALSDWLLWVNNILAGLILTLPFLFTRKLWIQVVWICLVDMLLLADIMYCRTYFTSIPLDSFGLISNLSDFTASIFSSISLLDLGFPIIIVASLILYCKIKPNTPPHRQLRYLSCIAILALISLVGIKLRGGFYKEYDRLVQSCYYSTCGSPTYTFAGHVLYSVLDQQNNSKSELTPQIQSWLSEHQEMFPHTALIDSIKPRKNLVVIFCESLESWVIESKINDKEITPYLNSLISDSTSFYAPDMLTQVAAGRSIDAQLLLHAGMLPMNGSVYSMKFPASTYPTINKALKEKYGTRSILLTCDKPITWNQEIISRSFGYDSLIDRRDWVIDELVGNPGKLSDGSFMRQSVAKLSDENLWQEGTPAMLTFITYSGHNPFKLPDSLRDSTFNVYSADIPTNLADYITMAHYTDSQLSTLINYLKSRSDWDETLVVIIGDHEGLASWRQEIRNQSAEAEKLVSAGQFTPFILLNSPITGRYDGTFGQIDMYPTLLNLLGLDNYQWHGLGTSLFNQTHPGFTISSMTNEIVGDTTKLSPSQINHIKHARSISDAIIRTDYFKTVVMPD